MKNKTSRIASYACCFLLLFHAPAHAAPVQEVVTPGGFKAWLIEEHSLPLVAAKILFTNAGTAYDPDGKEGRSLLATDMLLEGAGVKNPIDSLAFHEALESKAIGLETAVDEDHFYVTLQSLSEHKEEAFRLMGLALTQPRFDAEALTRIRNEAQSTLLQLEKDPSYRLSNAWKTTAFSAHPYSKPQNGTASSLNAISRDDLVAYQRRYITRGNILVAVVGDITPAQLTKLLDDNLQDLPKEYAQDEYVQDTDINTDPNPVALQSDIPQTLVMFGGAGIKRNDPRYFDAYIMNHILGGDGSLISRLGLAIRERRGLAYYADTALQPMRHAALWQGSFATRTEKVHEAVAALKTALQEFHDKGITQKELDEAKQYITGSFPLSLDSNASVANFLIAMQLHGLGRDYLDKRNAMVNAVSAEDVSRMAARLIDPQRMLLITIGKPANAPDVNAAQ